MAPKFKEVRLTAFRVYLPDDISVSLQEILEQIDKVLPDHHDRVGNGPSLFDNIVLSEFKYAPANTAIGAVFSTYEPGAKTSTLDFKNSQSALGQGEQEAGAGEEFLGINISILVEGNHLIACGMGKRASLIMQSILDLALRAGVISSTSPGRISEVPHNATAQDIIDHGVASIDLNVTNMLASLPALQKEGFIGKLFSPVPGVSDHELKRSVTANLTIKNKKLEYDTNSKEDWINDVAITAMEDEEVPSYRIVLGNGNELSANSLVLNTKVKVKKKSTTFDLDHLHLLMIAYLRELKENGLIT